MLDINVEKVAGIIKEAVSTIIMPSYQKLQSGDIREKKPGSIVTIVDEQSEKFLSSELKKLVPGCLVVGEESVSKDATILNAFKKDNPVLIIDPLDGTKRYTSGEGRFGVLVAVAFNNVVRYGWVYDAIEDRMIISQKGEGTYLEGEKLTCNDNNTDLKEMKLGFAQFDRYKVPFEDLKSEFNKVSDAGCSVEFSSDFMIKRQDVITYIGSTHPWDWSAPMLAIKEAGGDFRLNDGLIYKPNIDGKAFVVISPNKEVTDKTHRIISPRVLNKF